MKRRMFSKALLTGLVLTMPLAMGCMPNVESTNGNNAVSASELNNCEEAMFPDTHNNPLTICKKDEVPKDAKSYSADTYNLALLSNAKVELIADSVAKSGRVRITQREDNFVFYVEIESLNRFIRSFDTIETMLSYCENEEVELNDRALVYLVRNWFEPMYYVVDETGAKK